MLSFASSIISQHFVPLLTLRLRPDCARVHPTLYILDCEEICATQVTDQCQSWTLNGDQYSPVFVTASKTHSSVCLNASLVAESDECLRLQCNEKLLTRHW